MATSDLDYAKVTGRFALTVGDTEDPGDEPDIIWCNEGRVLIEPLVTYTKVAGAAAGPFSAGNAVIEAEIDAEGYLTYRGKQYVFVVDLTSPKVNPFIPSGATHKITFTDVKADGTPVTFPQVDVRLTAAGADGDGTNDLTVVMPVVPGVAQPIFRGEKGVSVAEALIDPETGELVFTFTDGTEQTAGPIPVTEAATAAAVTAEEKADEATTAATTATGAASTAATKATDADTAATAAATARTAAESARDELLDQKGEPGGLAPLDEAGKLAPEATPDHLTEPALSASIAEIAPDAVGVEKRAPAGTYTTGNVVLIGDHAYAANGIATAAVLGGATNYENVIGGNTANVDTATSNLVGAPALAAPDGNWSFIHGGYDNVVNGWACSVMGYHCKVGAGANHSTISGGSLHTVAAGATYNTIAGGTRNEVAGNNSTVGGGALNKATGNQSTVAGGQQNQATTLNATVSGGTANSATNNQATVGGGQGNTASGNSATVGGGLSNTATGTGALVPGGRENTAGADYAIATGRGAVATDVGQQAHSSGQFTAPGDAQANRWVLRRETTDGVAVELPGQPVIPEHTTWAFTGTMVARRADADGENAAWEVKGCMKRDAAGTAAFVGTPTVTSLGASAGNTWVFTVNTYSVGGLRLIVTGEAGKTIRWVIDLRATQVKG